MRILFYIITLIACLNAKEVVIKDILDREVKVDLPAKRIVLGFYYTDFLAVGGIEAFDKVVGFVKDGWAVYAKNSYEFYAQFIPRIKNLADVGDPQFGTFSAEKVLSLKPDLLILAAWQYEVIREDLAIFEKHNIPVVVIDYNQESVARHSLSTEILGQILGQEEKALELVDFYKSRISVIQERIKSASLPKPKIYIEFGNKGPNETGFTYGKDMWGALIDLAGGENIAAPFVKQWAPINPEQVLISKPDVIMIAGRETELKKNQEAMVMGFNIDEKEALKRLEAYKNRPGWSALPAIKDNRLYGLYMGASRTLADAAMIQYIAKALYPSLFEDIDPIQTYINFHKNYLPVIPEGTFGIQAK